MATATLTRPPFNPQNLPDDSFLIWCPKCRSFKSSTLFTRSRSRPTGHASYCKLCYAKVQAAQPKELRKRAYIKWRRSEKANKYFESKKPVTRLHLRLYKQKNPEKIKAHRRLQHAVECGRITKPAKCSLCPSKEGDPATTFGCVKIQAHHWHGYAPENWYNVIWLCGQCHKKYEKTAHWLDF